MLDIAGIFMEQGNSIACERKEGVNDNMTRSHYHEFYEIYYLESGQRYHIINDDVYFIKSGQFVIFPPYIMHRSYGDKDMSFKRILVYFKKDEINSSEVLEKLKNSAGVYTADNNTRFFIEQLLEKILKESESKNDMKKEYMNALLNLFVMTILRNTKPEPPPIKQNTIEHIIQYIHTHYNENISLDMLSQKFFISPYYLCREFKKNTNRTLVKYLNITRIMNAKRKLMETDKSITEIGNESGFSNITHFNRVFKELEKISPSEYKKAYK